MLPQGYHLECSLGNVCSGRLLKHLRLILLIKNILNALRSCRLAIIKHFADTENEVVRNNKIGSFYKYANNKLTCKSGVGLIKDSNGKVASDSFDRANCFNDYFASVFTVG